jgi:Dehydrogenases with different specificities (related to short-chain alcohol dehydrogenases)
VNRTDSGLNGKVAIVTGGTGGIGLAIARRCLAEGASVIISGRTDASVHTGMEKLGCPERVRGVAVDLGDASAPRELLSRAVEQFGAVDFLVNNAGISERKPMWEMDVPEWDRVFAVNLRAVFFCSVEFMSRLKAAGHPGAILNVSSVAGQNGGMAAGLAYAASKAAIIGLTRSLARHGAALGVRVNCIAPADIETAMTAEWPQALKDRLIGQTPMARFGDVDEVASAAAFLLGSQASYVTGQTLNVNGGLYMG